jgi:hypothetical protein
VSAQVPDQRLKTWKRLFQRALSIIDAALREAFGALDVLDFRRSYDECVGLVKKALR